MKPAALLWLLGACNISLAFPDEDQLSTFLVSIMGLGSYAAVHCTGPGSTSRPQAVADSSALTSHSCHTLCTGGAPDWLSDMDAAIWQVLLRGGAGMFPALYNTIFCATRGWVQVRHADGPP